MAALPRLHTSVRARQALRWGAVLLLLAGMRAVFGLHGDSRALHVTAAFAGGVGVALFLLQLITSTPDKECAFCCAKRANVAYLVAGPTVSICDSCAALSLGVSLAALKNAGASGLVFERLLGALPRHAPWSVSQSLLCALADCLDSTDDLRGVFMLGMRMHNYAAACALIERISERERSAADWVNLGVALGHLGRFEEAVFATRHAEHCGDIRDRALCMNNAAYFNLAAQPRATEMQLQRWLADVEQARMLLAGGEGNEVLACCYGTQALLQLALGNIDRAYASLANAECHAKPNGSRLLIRAKVALAAQRGEEARVDLHEALIELPAESHDAREARTLLGRLK